MGRDPRLRPHRLEREFVEAGVAQAQEELVAARERAAAEAAGRRRTRRLAVILAAALVVALVSAVVAIAFQRTATDRATDARAAETVADANRLAALSSSARALDVSLLLAAAAVRTADTPATRDGLLNALVEHRRATEVHQIGKEGIYETALSADGRTMMITVGGGSPEVLAWKTGSSEPPKRVTAWWPENIAVSPDGKTLVASATFTGSPSIRSWTRDLTPGPDLRFRDLQGFPRDIAFTPDGSFGRSWAWAATTATAAGSSRLILNAAASQLWRRSVGPAREMSTWTPRSPRTRRHSSSRTPTSALRIGWTCRRAA